MMFRTYKIMIGILYHLLNAGSWLSLL